MCCQSAKCPLNANGLRHNSPSLGALTGRGRSFAQFATFCARETGGRILHSWDRALNSSHVLFGRSYIEHPAGGISGFDRTAEAPFSRILTFILLGFLQRGLALSDKASIAVA